MKRTTKVERRRARRLWPGACQEFGTAWAARVGRRALHHLPLRVGSALRLPPWQLFEEVPKPPGDRVYPVVEVMVESWPQAQRMRWTRKDTKQWYVDEVAVIMDESENEMESWLRATEQATIELWTRSAYGA